MSILEQVGEALALSGAGDRAGARALLESLWATVGDEGDPLHRCAIAHSVADLQDAPQDELVWDLRALAAGRELTDVGVAEAGILGPAAAFFPSLQLNLADVYRRLGDAPRSREHVVAGRAALASMQPDGYREMIDEGLRRVDLALG